MAVKRVSKVTTTKGAVEVPEAVKVEEEVKVETPDVEVEEVAEEVIEDDIPEVEVEETPNTGVEIDTKAIKEETKPVAPKSVRVKMARDHKCNVGGEWYYLKEGQCYNVPENVKSILAKAGLIVAL